MSSDYQLFLLALQIRSGVSRLCRSCGPTAIFRTIRPIIIDAFNCEIIRRSWPHVCIEIFKRIEPPVTNRDSSTSVSVPVRFGFVRASLLHALPQIPFARNTSLTGHAVSRLALPNSFNGKAPTTDAIAIAKRCPINGAFGSAIASAKPFARFRNIFQYGPSSKLLICHVYEFWHTCTLLVNGRHVNV